MGLVSGTHWIGVFLLFASSILLLITTISAPVINDIGLLRVTLRQGDSFHHSSVNFGTFGYCLVHGANDQDFCSKDQIGYKPAHVIGQITGNSVDEIGAGTSDALTNVMVLHPIECGIAFIAFLLACGGHIIGSFAGAMVALLAWVLTLISLAVDFSLFGILHHHVNDNSNGRAHASFGIGIWTLLAAFVCLFFGMIIVFFTCCANRREKRRSQKVERESSPPRKKRFGIF